MRRAGLARSVCQGSQTLGPASRSEVRDGARPPSSRYPGVRMTEREQKHMQLGKFSLCLNVKDLQTSRVFYETLGFEVRAGNEADHWLLMTNGEAYIGLMQGMFEKNMLTFIPNQDHNGQQLPTFTDIRDIQKQLKEAGIAFEQEAQDGTGPASFLVLDPDGNPILFDQYVASSQ